MLDSEYQTIMELGQYLRELRKKHRYTQEYVAYKLNICRQTYSHYETGRINPSAEMLSQIANIYKVPLENLLSVLLIREDDRVDQSLEADTEMKTFAEFLADERNRKRLKSLDAAEKHLIYYYENMGFHDRIAAMTMIKVFFDHCVNKGMNKNNEVW